MWKNPWNEIGQAILVSEIFLSEEKGSRQGPPDTRQPTFETACPILSGLVIFEPTHELDVLLAEVGGGDLDQDGLGRRRG